METGVHRILLAGTGSGCGKTTAVCGILQAFVNRGLRTGAFKSGPDYIDPMFHSQVIGAKSANLDPFFFDRNTMQFLLAENGADRDISVIEGAMGFYDGAGLATSRASSWETAELTGTPVVLVVPARGAALSVLAVIAGFLDFQPGSHICGVILNRCSAAVYQGLSVEIRRRFGGRVKPLGFLPDIPECVLESRHLGLVTAAEVKDLRGKMQILAQKVEETIDLDGLLDLARGAPPLSYTPILPERREAVRIAVARDKAFCFYYEDSLQLLEKMGGELIPFSPLSDERLPEHIHGLYLGGGYPELYARELSQNVSMRRDVRRALGNGLPCIAECGGFMYLTEKIDSWPMAGFLPGTCWDNRRLTRFGYVTLRAQEHCLLCRPGEEVRGHEFHHWDAAYPGEGFTARKPSGQAWTCAHVSETLYAGFPHFHFYANPRFAENFYDACIKEKHRYAGNLQANGH